VADPAQQPVAERRRRSAALALGGLPLGRSR
jgi:hypothetical protein